jgi:hypothetical protein
MMAASSSTIRLALSIRRGQGSAPHAVAAALSTSSAADSSSRLLISSSNVQNRSHHHYQASSSQLNNDNAQWMNGLNQMMMNSSLYNSYNQSIVSSDRSRLCSMRWFSSSKSDEEEDQSKSPSATQQHQDDDNASTSTSSSSTTNDSATTTTSGSSQHNTWVEFQRSIAITGFETGQTVREQTLGKKSRGGKMDRKRKEREAELEAALRGADTTQLKGGEFPSLRYSDDETERLLAQAYAAIPPRAGKRGTRNLKRQKRRWEIKRQYDATKKSERIAEHGRRMAKRHEISQTMYNIRVEGVDVREREREYQMGVVERWAVMHGHAASGDINATGEEGAVKMET